MKYIIICSIAMLACIGVGTLLSILLLKRFSKLIKIITSIVISLLLMAILTLCYMGIYYKADDRATKALDGSENVSLYKIDGGYFFDGKGEGCALIFYGGAKVECEAYSALMLELAENGIDCFLIDMPFNFAIFGGNMADKIVDNYNYDTLLISGHSMGGMMASKYASEHKDQIDGIVLLASYSTDKIDDDIKVLSIYGTNDLCLDKEEYEKNKANLSTNYVEYIIDGGNHANFGDYGEQDGDGIATITPSEQQKLVVQKIIECFVK